MARFNPDLPLHGSTAIRFTVQTTTDGQECLTKFDYICTNDTTSPSLNDLISFNVAWQGALEAAFRALINPLTEITAYIVQELAYGLTPSYFNVLGSGLPGTAGTTSLPIEVAAVMKLLTTVKGQHGRGRTYYPGVPDTFITPATSANKLNVAGLAAYNSWKFLLLPLITGGTRTWQYSQLEKPVPPNTLFLRGIQITSLVMNAVLGTSRRRKVGRGI
jgi:hypothetical protein